MTNINSKIYFFLIWNLIIVFQLNAQNIEIPDSNFLHKLIQLGTDLNSDGLISSSEAETVTYLDISESGIEDVTGLQAFVNLDTLICSDNRNLAHLDISSNKELQYLSANKNQLTGLDVSENLELKYISCYLNDIPHLYVAELSKLEELICSHNRLSVLDISQNKNLRVLYCSNNWLTSISLCADSNLEVLDFGSNTLTSIDLSKQSNLVELNCALNKLENLDVSKCPEILFLRCANNSIENLDLSNNPNLINLSASSNYFQKLDLSNNSNLNSVSLQDMPLLTRVCVWSNQFSIPVEVSGSYNIYFTANCVEIKLDNPYSFPNPCSGLLTIVSDKATISQLKISDLSGKEVINMKPFTRIQVIDLSGIPKGVYILHVKSYYYEHSVKSDKSDYIKKIVLI